MSRTIGALGNWPKANRAPGGRAGVDARHVVDRPAVEQALDQLDDDPIGFAADGCVDERKLSDRFGAHHPFAVGAAHHDGHLGQTRFQPPRERQRRGVLLKAARDADHAGWVSRDAIDAPVEKGRNARAGSPDLVDQYLRNAGRAAGGAP
jgi:hypothetical protein